MSPRLPRAAWLSFALAACAASGTALGATESVPSAPGPATAFYYADAPPIALLSHFDRLVVEPDNLDRQELDALVDAGVEVYAYLSVGEAGPTRQDADAVRALASLGRNPAWQSDVMDLEHPAWTAYLSERADALVARGYHGLFLDTLDSFRLYALTDETVARQQAGLVAWIEGFAARHPDAGLIANRGFEVLDRIAGHLDALVAESLFVGWQASRGGYTAVEPEDRDWLLTNLREARDRHGLDVVVIDYLPPSMREEARRVAADIATEGFVPWVSTPALDQVGVGAREVFPREVLMLYDSRHDGPQSESGVHRYVATPLEYAGYVPVYIDLATDTAPAGVLQGRYAAVVTWTDAPYDDVAGLADWFELQLANGVRLAMFGTLPVTPTLGMLERLGVSVVGSIDARSLELHTRDRLIAGERELPPRLELPDLSLRSVSPANRKHLTLADREGATVDAVVSGPWGGYALYPYANETDLDDTVYWLLDPHAFLDTALDLPTLPMPDVTTRGGKRLWFAHIDGDALPSWAEMPGRRLGAEFVETEILERFPLPHTVSVVEAEMNALDELADRRARMFDTMRRIFARPGIELASHTFSHPFFWNKVGPEHPPGRFNLPVENYAYDIEREVAGSVAFIDRELAPPGKRTAMFLWSGDALPGEAALRAVDRLGLVAMNGGNTVVTRTVPALSLVSPMARSVGSTLQIYAPIMNENVYTNDWLGPFDGFRRVIETLEMTDRPRRLKPLNIYYHFYIGTKPAALRSLREVYDWSLTQDIAPVYASEYAALVPAFRRASVSRDLDGLWTVRGLAGVRSLRLIGERLWPVLDAGGGIAGVRQLHDGSYLHSDGRDVLRFRTTDAPPTRAYLVATNGRLDRWTQGENETRFRIRGRVPVTLIVGAVNEPRCAVRVGDATLEAVDAGDGTLRVEFPANDTGDAVLRCDA